MNAKPHNFKPLEERARDLHEVHEGVLASIPYYTAAGTEWALLQTRVAAESVVTNPLLSARIFSYFVQTYRRVTASAKYHAEIKSIEGLGRLFKAELVRLLDETDVELLTPGIDSVFSTELRTADAKLVAQAINFAGGYFGGAYMEWRQNVSLLLSSEEYRRPYVTVAELDQGTFRVTLHEPPAKDLDRTLGRYLAVLGDSP